MSDKNHLPPNSLHGASLPDAHAQDKMPHDQVIAHNEVAQLQARLRQLRAQAASSDHLQKSEADQRHLIEEINSAVQRLHELGAQEQEQQP